MSYRFATYEKRARIANVTLNRPEVTDAATPAQMYQLWRTLSLALLPDFSRWDPGQRARGLGLTTRFSDFLVAVTVAIALRLAEPFVTSVYGGNGSGRGAGALLVATIALRFVFFHGYRAYVAQPRGGAHLAVGDPADPRVDRLL